MIPQWFCRLRRSCCRYGRKLNQWRHSRQSHKLHISEQDSRETFAIGMMFTYSALTKQVKGLQFSTPINALKDLTKSFAVLEKNGFDVKEPQLQIHKVLSLKDMQAKKAEQVKHAEKELEEKILEVQRIKEKADKELEEKILEVQRSKEKADREFEGAVNFLNS